MVTLAQKLSRQHENDVAESLSVLGSVHHAKSSGNQWHDSGDGRHGVGVEWGLGWDCKAAMPGTQSIRVTREMVAKIGTQSHGNVPALMLRFYENERGGYQDAYDLAVVPLSYLSALLEEVADWDE